MQAVLFDLDGTLLDIELGTFLSRYFRALGEAAAERWPDVAVTDAVLASTQVMQAPHPGVTNAAAFAADFRERTGIDLDDPADLGVFDAFYAERFPLLADGAGPMPGARRAVETALELGLGVVVATQPIFPRAAIEHRIAWAGLADLELPHLTTYEIMHACKPMGAYFAEAAALVGADPSACLMVGDDRSLDLPAADIGMRTFYVRDDGAPSDYTGDMDALADLLPRLVCADDDLTSAFGG